MAWGYAVALRGELRCGGGARAAHPANDDCAACLCGMGAAAKALLALRQPDSSGGRLYTVDCGYFCCGVMVEGGFVKEAAPILGWATGKPESELRRFVASKGGTMAEHKAPGWLGGLVLACDSPPLVRALWDWTAAEIPARHGRLAAAAVGAVLAAVGPDGAWFGACDYPGDWLDAARAQAARALAGLAKGAAA
jgi:hypothetical protein